MDLEPTRIDLVTRLREQALLGQLSRRSVLKRAMALGLSAPVIAGLLAACGGDDDDDDEPAATAGGGQADPTATTAEAEPTEAEEEEAEPTEAEAEEEPTEAETEASPTAASSGETDVEPGQGRGVGDLLRILYWQAPTILNSHFAQGDKDTSAASLVLEPLLTINSAGEFIPVLIAEIPTLENGGLSEDGMSVTYKLKEGIVWSDGEPFTAEDVQFTFEWVTNTETSATTIATYEVIESIDVIDDLTAQVNFKAPNPEWFGPFGTSYGGHVIPKHILQDFTGAAARDAEFNLRPTGTGAYMVADFRPGDVVIYEINENYRDETRPYFQTVELKGGGDATGAARAAMQSGETDWGWNLQVEKAVLDEMSASAETGELVITPGQSIERILVNFADPNTEVDGARSEPSTQHPYNQFLEVRQAMAMGCDRDTIAEQLYGAAGQATANLLVSPERFVSPNTSYTFDTEAASQMLEDAGWTGNPRAKDGVEMRALYQTTINPVRQKTQEIIKQAWESMGVPTELKSIDAGVYFSSDAGNPDTAAHFYADYEMYTNGPASPYPIAYMAGWKSTDPAVDIAQKANNWSGANYERWVNEEYNVLYEQATQELDPDTQAELFIAMNDMVVNEVVEIALVHRNGVSAASSKLRGYERSVYETDIFDVVNWYFEE
jgi:peptide/nickel transport system substrate-binding protein